MCMRSAFTKLLKVRYEKGTLLITSSEKHLLFNRLLLGTKYVLQKFQVQKLELTNAGLM